MKKNNVDHNMVKDVEFMMREASVDTRAAVAALALPGRIRAFSPHYAALAPRDQERLATGVAAVMHGAGAVASVTGISAALAMNWCEAHGRNYRLTRMGDAYTLETLL